MRTHLSDANYDKQTIAQLYKSIALLSKHIVEDNSKCNDVYPIGVRTIQLVTLKALIREVETHH